jgi:hypothetical protein
VLLLADKAEIVLSTEVRRHSAFGIYTHHRSVSFLTCSCIFSDPATAAAAVQLRPCFIYCRIFTSSDHMLSGRTRPGHLGSLRLSKNWCRRVNFRPRPPPPPDLPVWRILYVAVTILMYLSTDMWSCLELPPKVCYHSSQRISSTVTVWHATRCPRQVRRADTIKTFSSELRMASPAPFTATGTLHKHSGSLNG